jgi:hypothetical protein
MEFVIGIFVGALLFWLLVDRKKPSGTFIIDCSDPMRDEFCTLDLHESLDSVWRKKKIVLKVKTLSQK